MKYTIKRYNKILAQVVPQGTVSTKIMGEELVNMTFELPQMLKFQVGDAVEVYGVSYQLLQAPVVEKINTRLFKYSLEFGSIKYELSKIQLLFPDSENKLSLSEGDPIGDADLLLTLILNNANRVGSGWKKGEVLKTETKQVNFNQDNCLSALSKIAETFEIEYWIDSNKLIHIGERKQESGYSLQYGQNRGLKSITRTPMDGSNIVTRLYATGSEKNIGSQYRNGSKRLKMEVPYLEKNTQIYSVIEHVEKFEDIFPKRLGKVTAVDVNNPLVFSDATLDFNLNQRDSHGTTILIKGVSPKVAFQTGQLAGYVFEIKEQGYNSKNKSFSLLKNKDEKALEVPNQFLRPQVGDTYIITDIAMPLSYIVKAEAELKAKAQEYLDKNSKERIKYTVVSDPLYFKGIQANIKLGYTVHFKDEQLGLDAHLRILSISKDLQNPYKVSFEIGESAQVISIVRAYIEKEKQQSALIKTQKDNAQLARRSYEMDREEFDKYFDNSGYLDPVRIKPQTIETGMLSIGSRSQQLSLANVVLEVSPDNKRLINPRGQLIHLSMDPKKRRTWEIAEGVQQNISEKFNYIYVKVHREGSKATIEVTEKQIGLENEPLFYYFLVGSLSSVIDGFRRIKTHYGFTQISPREITTGRIRSADGNNWIDLLQDSIEINARVRFAPGSPAQKYVDEKFTTAKLNTEKAIDQMSIGGRNLMKDSEAIALWSFSGSRVIHTLNFNVTEWGASTAVRHQVSEGSHILKAYITLGVIPKGGFQSLSFYAKNLGGAPITFYSNQGGRSTVLQPNESKRIVWERIAGDGIGSLQIQCRTATGSAGFVLWRAQQESGHKATDWTPAPEDVEQRVDTKLKNNESLTKVALANAQNAQATASRVSQLTNFLNTSVNGNVVGTGTLMVGNIGGANAGITGVTDKGPDSVRFFAGSPYAKKDTAPLTILDKGLIKLHHPNGRVGFELGIVNGKLVFNVYDDAGNKTMEMGPRGIIFAEYVADSWSNYSFIKFPDSSYDLNNTDSVINYIKSNLDIKRIWIAPPPKPPLFLHHDGYMVEYEITFPQKDSVKIPYSRYRAGRSYDSNTYVEFENLYFKGEIVKPSKPNHYMELLPDGWYYSSINISVYKDTRNPDEYEIPYQFDVDVIRLQKGIQVESKSYTYSSKV
ncbi:hypothetical protein GNY06_12600 [Elizabethkingia argentiflava]|uniref:Tail spike domain-containing protein n=1 Tax=Elizabethkingia argenteiflava TaxID=2681556 RepID=A0A845Q0L3_9FLAO|nr:phage tail protein [Elizabethkingia argenteiflava]NAW52178.1 hypothetical protein [Elizabethkingia argenteiflava]